MQILRCTLKFYQYIWPLQKKGGATSIFTNAHISNDLERKNFWKKIFPEKEREMHGLGMNFPEENEIKLKRVELQEIKQEFWFDQLFYVL